MSNLLFKAMLMFGVIGLFINWGLNNAYPQ
jgi:hypothetical protein